MSDIDALFTGQPSETNSQFHHRKAAEHHAEAARQHQVAASLLDNGDGLQASRYAQHALNRAALAWEAGGIALEVGTRTDSQARQYARTVPTPLGLK
jgi:hypothetical protein